MKRIVTCLLAIIAAVLVQAQSFNYRSGDLEIALDNRGYLTSVKVGKQELLRERQPFAITFNEEQRIPPFLADTLDGMLAIKMNDGGRIFLNIEDTPKGLSIEVALCSEPYNTLVLCPIVVNLNEEVSELAGIAQGGKTAFGIQAMNAKTCAGTPPLHTQRLYEYFRYTGPDEQLPSNLPATQLAALSVPNGTRFQFYSCRRNSTRHPAWQQPTSFPYYLYDEDDDATIVGTKIVLWGCTRNNIDLFLNKSDIPAGCLIASLDNNFDVLLEKCQELDAQHLIFDNLFISNGTYPWNPSTGITDSAWKHLQAKAADKGIQLGAQVSVGRVSTTSHLVAPIPSNHLIKEDSLFLTEALDDKQEAFCIEDAENLRQASTWNILQIDDELILFNSIEEDATGIYLNGCTRGAFGTKVQAHDLTATVYKLWVATDSTLRTDLLGQDEMARYLANRCNDAGLQCLLLKDEECLQFTGHGSYAPSRFMNTFYQHLKKDVMVFPSLFTHFQHTVAGDSHPHAPVIDGPSNAPSTPSTLEFYKRNRLPILIAR